MAEKKKKEDEVAPAAIPGMYGDSPGVRAVKAVAGAVGSSQERYAENSSLTVRPTLGPPAPAPPVRPEVVGTAGPAGSIPELAAALNKKNGRAPAAGPAAAAAAPPAPAAATKPSIADLSFNAENPTYKGPKLASQAEDYLNARMPNVGDTRMALPGGGYGSAADALGPAARPSIPADYDASNPAQIQLKTGVATQVNPATLADVQAHWNPQQGAGRGGAPNIFMDMIPESIRGAVSSRFGGGSGISGISGQEDPEREARMNADSRSIIGPNGRVSRSMARLKEQEMQGADTRRGQDINADVATRGQNIGVFNEGMRQSGEERRSIRSDETTRRSQDMGFQAGQEARAGEIEREGMGNRTSLAVADRNLAGQIYSADQRVATSAATSLAKQAGMDDSTINKLMEISINPDTGEFSPEAFKANYLETSKLVGSGAAAGGEKKIVSQGKDRKSGRTVVKYSDGTTAWAQ